MLVTFQPGAKAGDIAALLTGLHATIVSGPKLDGSYVVEIPAGDPDATAAGLLSHKDLVATAARGQ